MKQKFQWNQMTLGTCYYPEHWEESLWEEDLTRMLNTGITVIRIAEFAWSKFEREEGIFDFSFFDRFLELCVKVNMKVIFGTPTATPPAWLTEKYPEVLNSRKDGVLYRHGGRRHYNYNSPVYQELSKRIVTKLAEHYGKHPALIGWQIDNEFNCEACEYYSEADSIAFRSFVQKKYVTLEQLNDAWGTVFWNQTYTDWSQIYVPREVLGNGVNPHMFLDYYRFISESTIRFCAMQAEIISRYRKPEDFITTNGKFWNIDNHRMTEECLDIYSYDSYPDFGFDLSKDFHTSTDLNDRQWSRNLDEVRSICPHFMIMEQQSGANGWVTRMEAPAPRPGQLLLWAMQSVAHGADFISFFRWRTSTIGTEIYWHGILDYDNRDNRKLREVKNFSQKLQTLQPICGAEYTTSFAIVRDYSNEWDTSVDVWHRRVHSASEQELFVVAEQNHLPYDYTYLRESTTLEDLVPYSVLVYPHPVIITKEQVLLLKQYVEQGGTLIIGCRSGYKEEHGKCVMLPQPGLLQELTGTDVRDFTFTNGSEADTYAIWNDTSIDTPMFNDILTPLPGTTVLASYANSYYATEAALTEHSVGKGKVLHFGSTFSRTNAVPILSYAGVKSPFRGIVEAPEGVELILRQNNDKNYVFVLNFMPESVNITWLTNARCLYDNKKVSKGVMTYGAFETGVYELE